jgi:hypothetical protein
MGPIIFISLGASGLAVFASYLTPYRPVFIIISALLLYLSYSSYEKKGVKNKGFEIFFLITMILILIFLLAPALYSIIRR